jgi:hypothetical protein
MVLSKGDDNSSIIISTGIYETQYNTFSSFKIGGFFSILKRSLSFLNEPKTPPMYKVVKFGQNSIMLEIQTKCKLSNIRVFKDLPNTLRSGTTKPSNVIPVSFGRPTHNLDL